MKIAIMQPYFLPYIGYFQLMNAVDEFVVYDGIKFTKGGWINRNRILANGKDSYITIPLKKDSDYLDVRDRFLADSWPVDRRSILNRIAASYRKAPYFNTSYPLFERVILFEEVNLFSFIFNSLRLVKEYLGIRTELLISSAIPIDDTLRREHKVIAICRARKADTYLNPINGIKLYDKGQFSREGINLHFLKADELTYRQLENDFIAWLSILDVMMFNSRETIGKLLNQYTLR